MHNLDHYYKVLGLEPGTSLAEVNQAYKDLAFIWHPDRIPKDNPRLMQKAQDKLKEINHARDQLRRILPNIHPQNSPSSPTPKSSPHDHKQPPRYYRPTSQSNQAKKPNDALSGADLRGACLKEKDLSGRNLSNANLSQADLSDAFLHKVNLHQANLYRANLFRANLLQSNLYQADLQEANLIGADLSGADLRQANLRGAKVGTKDRLLVKLTGANMAGAIMPDGTIHD